MYTPLRLLSLPGSEPEEVRFAVAWAAPTDDFETSCAAAILDTGDGATLDLGRLCASTATTWHAQHQADLLPHTYSGPGPFTARLQWNDGLVEATVTPGIPDAAAKITQPLVELFGVAATPDPLRKLTKVKLTGLTPGQRVRLDGGAGQIYNLASGPEGHISGEWPLVYLKPGPYTVALDLLDADDFYAGTLTETPLEVAAPAPAPPLGAPLLPPQEPVPITPAGRPATAARPADVSTALPETQPWLPYRYCHTAWNWVRLSSVPGGGQVTRVVGGGTYLSIRAEVAVGGAIWYQTAGDDWVAADSVTLYSPSELRGVELGDPLPPPPTPPPDPPAPRQGVVTADVLNVRAAPGVRPDNPPVDRLYNGAAVGIYEETTSAGEVWYRIGADRWAHSGFITITSAPPAPPPPVPPTPPPTTERYGVVAADILNVRAAPGVRADNPPVDHLASGAAVTIYEERAADGETWYRIGPARWVYGGYVMLVDAPPAPPPTPPTPPSPPTPVVTRRGVVTADVLNVRARPGVRADNPPVAQLVAGAEVTIYEEAQEAGVTWYRIGSDRWVHGGWLHLTEEPTRAAGITRAVALAATEAVSLPVGWVVAPSLNVRARPGITDDNPPVDQVLHNQRVPILDTRSAAGATWYRIGADRWVEGEWIGVARSTPRPSGIGPDERWVGVSLMEQTAVAYEGDRPVYAALVATGLPGTPTVQGLFRTWKRLETGLMVGPGYFIEDVTWTCYFYSGYALHVAYWHDAFGRPRSHGCVNLSPYDAWWIFQWSSTGGPTSPAVYVTW